MSYRVHFLQHPQEATQMTSLFRWGNWGTGKWSHSLVTVTSVHPFSSLRGLLLLCSPTLPSLPLACYFGGSMCLCLETRNRGLECKKPGRHPCEGVRQEFRASWIRRKTQGSFQPFVNVSAEMLLRVRVWRKKGRWRRAQPGAETRNPLEPKLQGAKTSRGERAVASVGRKQRGGGPRTRGRKSAQKTEHQSFHTLLRDETASNLIEK